MIINKWNSTAIFLLEKAVFNPFLYLQKLKSKCGNKFDEQLTAQIYCTELSMLPPDLFSKLFPKYNK